MALIGGIFALSLTGTPFSISAAIGFVALFGIAAMDGIMVLVLLQPPDRAGLDRTAAHPAHLSVQMRPVLMTCMAACVGLLPAALSTGIGTQVQRPLALVVVGGMLLAPALILIVLPVLIDMFSRRRPDDGAPRRRSCAGSRTCWPRDCLCCALASARRLRGRARFPASPRRRQPRDPLPARPLARPAGGRAQRLVQARDIPGRMVDAVPFARRSTALIAESADAQSRIWPRPKRRCGSARRTPCRRAAHFSRRQAGFDASRNKHAARCRPR